MDRTLQLSDVTLIVCDAAYRSDAVMRLMGLCLCCRLKDENGVQSRRSCLMNSFPRRLEGDLAADLALLSGLITF